MKKYGKTLRELNKFFKKNFMENAERKALLETIRIEGALTADAWQGMRHSIIMLEGHVNRRLLRKHLRKDGFHCLTWEGYFGGMIMVWW